MPVPSLSVQAVGLNGVLKKVMCRVAWSEFSYDLWPSVNHTDLIHIVHNDHCINAAFLFVYILLKNCQRSVCVCVYVCMYVCMYVYMLVCMYIYIYTYTHIHEGVLISP